VFHVIGVSFTFSNTLMSIWWEDQLIGFPYIAETLTTLVVCMDTLSKPAAGVLTSISDGIGDDLTCATTHDRPTPAFSPLFEHK